jgi:hypothetical protein
VPGSLHKAETAADMDPTWRSLKFRTGLEELLAPYRNILKDLKTKAKQEEIADLLLTLKHPLQLMVIPNQQNLHPFHWSLSSNFLMIIMIHCCQTVKSSASKYFIWTHHYHQQKFSSFIGT